MTQAYFINSEHTRNELIHDIRNIDLAARLVVEIKPVKRSTMQNRLYWMWLKEISGQIGYEVDELHLMFREEVLPHVLGHAPVVVVRGKRYLKDLSTTDCTTKQFTDYLDRIERFANIDIGITLSHPDDVYQEAMGRGKRA